MNRQHLNTLNQIPSSQQLSCKANNKMSQQPTIQLKFYIIPKNWAYPRPKKTFGDGDHYKPPSFSM